MFIVALVLYSFTSACLSHRQREREESREGRKGQGRTVGKKVREEYKLEKVTCQQPRSTPVEVKTTLSRTIFKGQRPSATALTAAASASI